MKVFIQQPVIPEYRVPLFNALSSCGHFELEIHASSYIPNNPVTADPVHFAFKFVEHPCKLKLFDRAFYQRDMYLPSGYGPKDVVIYNSNPRFLSNFRLVYEAQKAGCRVIAWNHADSSTSGWFTGWVRKWLTSLQSDDILLYTEFESRKYKRKTFYLNNTLDESQIKNAIISYSGKSDIEEAKKSEIVKSFKKSNGINNKKVFLFCGRITEKAQLNTLIDALIIIKNNFDERMALLVIGEGDFRKSLESRVKEVGLISVYWLGAIYGEGKLAPWFLAADYFIYPGAIGLSANHAMSYGLPVITHDRRSCQMPEFDYLVDGENALFYEYGNISSLSKICIECDSTPKKLSSYAVSTMYKKFSFEKMVKRFIKCVVH